MSQIPTTALLERAKKIRLFLMDVDGTLTDGGVCLIALPNDGGIAELKIFNSLDGLGLTVGQTYPLDFFSAERHVYGSNIEISTTLALQPPQAR